MMKTSQDITEITKALVAFHSEVGRIQKDGTNPHLRNRYATIDQIIEEIRPILASHGLFIMQLPTNSEAGEIQMTTRIYHTSGQWMQSPTLTINPQKKDAQGIGSAITYARRYSLTSFLGLNTGEDDDGHRASGGGHGQARQQYRGKQQAGKGQPQPVQRTRMEKDPLTEKKRAILTACHAKGLTDQQAAKVVTTLLKRDSNNMTMQEAGQILEVVQTSVGNDLLDLIGEGEPETVEVEVVEEEPEPEEPPITKGQMKAIHAASRDKGLTEEERRAVIRHVSKGRTDSSKGLYHREAREVINTINGNKKEAIQRLAGTFEDKPEEAAKLNGKSKDEDLREFFTEWQEQVDQMQAQ